MASNQISAREAALAFGKCKRTINRWAAGASSAPVGFPARVNGRKTFWRDEIGRCAYGTTYPA